MEACHRVWGMGGGMRVQRAGHGVRRRAEAGARGTRCDARHMWMAPALRVARGPAGRAARWVALRGKSRCAVVRAMLDVLIIAPTYGPCSGYGPALPGRPARKCGPCPDMRAVPGHAGRARTCGHA
ncbi:hypothetical protein GCM10023259_098620 [Thermocatellispora tengchongensis]